MKEEQEKLPMAREMEKVNNAYRRLFNTEDGEIVLQDLMKVCGFASDAIHESSNMMAYYEGRRSVIIQILNTVYKTNKQMAAILKQMQAQQDRYID